MQAPLEVREASLLERLREEVRRVLGLDAVPPADATVLALGGDSLTALRIAHSLAGLDAVEAGSPVGSRQRLQGVLINALLEPVSLEQVAREWEQSITRPVEPASSRRAETTSNTRPLSYGQKRMWIPLSLEPSNPAYNIANLWEIDGYLDRDALRGALRQLIDRHDILRTRIVQQSSALTAVTESYLAPLIVEWDVSRFVERDRSSACASIEAAYGRWNFDLERGPLLIVVMIKLDTAIWRVLFVTHHIAADGWSIALLYRDLSALYQARLEQQQAKLPQAHPYALFSDRERATASASAREAHCAYWSAALQGASWQPAFPPTYRVARRHTRGVASSASKYPPRWRDESTNYLPDTKLRPSISI